jgi:hypothetical protein
MRHQCIEVSLIIIANVTAESSGPLAVENDQLGQSLGIANSLLVIRDGPLGLGDRGVLPPEHVRPEPPINDFLVRFQNILAPRMDSSPPSSRDRRR